MAALDSYVLTTELDAVNMMLSCIGEAPVSVLAESGLGDVSIAKTILAETNRRVQAKGWDFNTDVDYDLALNGDNKVPVPANALRIDCEKPEMVQRAGFFYDRRNNTFTLSEGLRCEIVRYFPFESIPESARYFIGVKSSRIFQKKMLGDDSLEVFTEKEEADARADFENAHNESRDTNALNTLEIMKMTRGGREGGFGLSGLGDPRII